MKVLLIEPHKAAREAEIGSSLKDMQDMVGGLIHAIYPYREPIAIVCNDEGKLLMLPLNRALRDSASEIYDIIAGTFFICGLDEDNFASLPKEHMDKFMKEFRDPEIFTYIDGRILAAKAPEQSLDLYGKHRNHNEPER